MQGNDVLVTAISSRLILQCTTISSRLYNTNTILLSY